VPDGSCLVITVGTAVTIDALDDKGVFLGGLIVPGFGLMLDALEAGTAGLRVHSGDFQSFPTNTINALMSGGGSASRWRGCSPDRAHAACCWPAAPRQTAPHLRFAYTMVDNLVLGLAASPSARRTGAPLRARRRPRLIRRRPGHSGAASVPRHEAPDAGGRLQQHRAVAIDIDRPARGDFPARTPDRDIALLQRMARQPIGAEQANPSRAKRSSVGAVPAGWRPAGRTVARPARRAQVDDRRRYHRAPLRQAHVDPDPDDHVGRVRPG
jgi:hypothetical protein